MRILGHIHTFNDEEIIDRTVQALLDQTYPVDEIVLVDNASQDRTLARSFPKQVIIIRHSENQGTSGAVATGMEYALGKQYDWIYLLDADSLPRKDALQRLIEFYEGLPLKEPRVRGPARPGCAARVSAPPDRPHLNLRPWNQPPTYRRIVTSGE